MIYDFPFQNPNTNTEITTTKKEKEKKKDEHIIKKQEWQRSQKKMVENESKSLRVSYDESVIEGELASMAR